MKNSAALIVLVFALSMALVIPQGQARKARGLLTGSNKNQPFVGPDCVKAKLGLAICVKEKFLSPWSPEPTEENCCDEIADLHKNCPSIVSHFDDRFIPIFIKDACSAPGPSAPAPSA